MASISARYTAAIATGNLRPSADGQLSPVDVLGAAGFAGKQKPLALALLRLHSGDNHAAPALVGILAGMLDGKAYRLGVPITRAECRELAAVVLAWHCDGACRPCGGLGFRRVDGAPALSAHQCNACHGSGRLPLASLVQVPRRDLAHWLASEVEREESAAGAGLARAAGLQRE